MANIPYTGAGVAGFETEDYSTQVLITGDTPISTTHEVAAAAAVASAALPENAVVGRNGAGEVVLAQYGTIDAIGITCTHVNQGATVRNVPVRRTGMFNPKALVFHSSFDTDEKKRLAFEAAAPGIFIKEVGYEN